MFYYIFEQLNTAQYLEKLHVKWQKVTKSIVFVKI